MPDLHITATGSTPEIIADHAAGMVRMVGDAYPENAFELFHPIIEWIEHYLKQEPARAFILDVELVYLNTSSIRAMMDIFDSLEDAHGRDVGITVRWYFDAGNGRVGDLAKEFREDYSFPFQVIGRE